MTFSVTLLPKIIVIGSFVSRLQQVKGGTFFETNHKCRVISGHWTQFPLKRTLGINGTHFRGHWRELMYTWL